MEYEYSIDDGRNMGYLAIRGECGIRELESVFLEVTEDKRFNPDFDILTDLRECTFTFRPNEMSGFFGMFNEGLRSGR